MVRDHTSLFTPDSLTATVKDPAGAVAAPPDTTRQPEQEEEREGPHQRGLFVTHGLEGLLEGYEWGVRGSQGLPGFGQCRRQCASRDDHGACLKYQLEVSP